MTVKFNVPGKERKRMVLTIAKWLGEKVCYKGAPTFAYEVDYFTIDKDGNLIFDDRADSEVIERLLEHLYDEGFESDISTDEPKGIAIQIPMADFTEASLQNLFDLVESKGSLIKKALGIDDLPINLIGERLDFPWFNANNTPDEIKTYMDFVTALCNMAKTQKRINAKEKTVDNEKYAFRCFLLRLGFIGEEYKTARKILLKNLSGSSAFKQTKIEPKTYKVELDNDDFRLFTASNDHTAQQCGWEIAKAVGSEFCEITEVKEK